MDGEENPSPMVEMKCSHVLKKGMFYVEHRAFQIKHS